MSTIYINKNSYAQTFMVEIMFRGFYYITIFVQHG